MSHIRFGSRIVDQESPCFLVAEIGINHNGDLDLARKSIDAAVHCGADSVKFQYYRTEDFLSDRSLRYEYSSQGATVVESQYSMFKRCELSRDALSQLKAHCDRMGVIFHCTPTSESGLKELLKLGVPVLKNGSDYLTHIPLIRAMGKTGLPTVLSTGMATKTEIDEAVRAFRETGNDQLILLHCTSMYPTPPEEVHLQKIASLQRIFRCPVGFSDHTEGISAAVGATALGARWIEKHFTLDKHLPGPDHAFSADPAEFSSLVGAIRFVERCLGDPHVGPTAGEKGARRDFRLSCAAAAGLSAGHLLNEADLAFLRPGTGLPPSLSHLLTGRRLARAIRAGELITMEDLA